MRYDLNELKEKEKISLKQQQVNREIEKRGR
jgi:hypothetical protein